MGISCGEYRDCVGTIVKRDGRNILYNRILTQGFRSGTLWGSRQERWPRG